MKRPARAKRPPFDKRFSRCRIGIVAATFYGDIVRALLAGAQKALTAAGVRSIDLVTVPGCLELPIAALRMIRKRRYDAVVALGCVIKGETDHHRYVASECMRGLMDVSLRTATPITFGVLTVASRKQATSRLGKGHDAALAALQVVAATQFLI